MGSLFRFLGKDLVYFFFRPLEDTVPGRLRELGFEPFKNAAPLFGSKRARTLLKHTLDCGAYC